MYITSVYKINLLTYSLYGNGGALEYTSKNLTRTKSLLGTKQNLCGTSPAALSFAVALDLSPAPSEIKKIK